MHLCPTWLSSVLYLRSPSFWSCSLRLCIAVHWVLRATNQNLTISFSDPIVMHLLCVLWALWGLDVCTTVSSVGNEHLRRTHTDEFKWWIKGFNLTWAPACQQKSSVGVNTYSFSVMHCFVCETSLFAGKWSVATAVKRSNKPFIPCRTFPQLLFRD